MTVHLTSAQNHFPAYDGNWFVPKEKYKRAYRESDGMGSEWDQNKCTNCTE